MTYVEYINRIIRECVSNAENLACYGQNIVTGSCLSGLTRDLSVPTGSIVCNTPNSENTLVGMGFGTALRGGNAIYFMKQLDFLLLGLDQVVNTWNVVRMRQPAGSFTIFAIVVDSGFEGPQSCFNDLQGISSLAHLPAHSISDVSVAEPILDKYLISPGCRIIAVSQRLFRQSIPDQIEIPSRCDPDCQLFKFGSGQDVTLASFNFSAPQTFELRTNLETQGIDCSVFVSALASPRGWDQILDHACESGVLVVVDDGKGENRASDRLISEALKVVCGIVFDNQN